MMSISAVTKCKQVDAISVSIKQVGLLDTQNNILAFTQQQIGAFSILMIYYLKIWQLKAKCETTYQKIALF